MMIATAGGAGEELAEKLNEKLTHLRRAELRVAEKAAALELCRAKRDAAVREAEKALAAVELRRDLARVLVELEPKMVALPIPVRDLLRAEAERRAELVPGLSARARALEAHLALRELLGVEGAAAGGAA